MVSWEAGLVQGGAKSGKLGADLGRNDIPNLPNEPECRTQLRKVVNKPLRAAPETNYHQMQLVPNLVTLM